jgi:hypothetical protein
VFIIEGGFYFSVGPCVLLGLELACVLGLWARASCWAGAVQAGGLFRFV